MTRSEFKANLTKKQKKLSKTFPKFRDSYLQAWDTWRKNMNLLHEIRGQIADKLDIFQKDYDYEQKLINQGRA